MRDLLLGRESEDYDVATSATPDVVLGMFPRTFAVGAHFGVVLVATTSRTCATCGAANCATCGGANCACALEGDASACGAPNCACARESDAATKLDFFVTEVATFRSDGVYSDGRHPDVVRYTRSAEEDVQRRDFTINGLLLDPLRGDETLDELASDLTSLREAVIDYVGEVGGSRYGSDSRDRGSPKRRFEEDHLRMLRAVRFAARFGFALAPSTFAAMRALAGRIHAVSRERIRDELTKMLTEGKARRAFELLDETGLLAQVLPEIAKMKGVEQPPQFHPEGDVWIHTLMLLEQLEAGSSPTLAWGALLHDVGKPSTFRISPERIRFDGHVEVGVAIGAEICRRFRFSNEETRQILALIENHMRFADAPHMRASTLKRFFRLERFNEHLAMHRMDCMAAHGNLDNWHFVREHYEATPEEVVRPKPLVTGRELIAAGYVPGAPFKVMLRAVEDAQLEGTICTVDEAMSLVRERFGPPALQA